MPQHTSFKTDINRIELNTEDLGFTLKPDEQTLRDIKEIEENTRRAMLLSPFIFFD